MALRALRAQLKAWRHDRTLRIHTRAIIVVERLTRAAT
jgi:L-lysine 2,3-aminomutase